MSDIPQVDLALNIGQDFSRQFQWLDDSLSGLVLAVGGGSGVGGSNYPAGQTVLIGPPALGGVQATATCTVASGAIAALTLTGPGSGYDPTNPPPVYFPPVNGVQGTGAVVSASVGNPIDLTASQLEMMVRRSPGNATVLLTFGTASPLTGLSIPSPATNGNYVLTIPRTQVNSLIANYSYETGQLLSAQPYVYDILQLRPDGIYWPIQWGNVYVGTGVTRP